MSTVHCPVRGAAGIIYKSAVIPRNGFEGITGHYCDKHQRQRRILRPTARVRIRLRIPTRTETISTTARRPRLCRR
jgi:hypothetical protein